MSGLPEESQILPGMMTILASNSEILIIEINNKVFSVNSNEVYFF